MLRLRVVSKDGRTRVENAFTGERIPGVMSVTFTHSSENGPLIQLTVLGDEHEIDAAGDGNAVPGRLQPESESCDSESRQTDPSPR